MAARPDPQQAIAGIPLTTLEQLDMVITQNLRQYGDDFVAFATICVQNLPEPGHSILPVGLQAQLHRISPPSQESERARVPAKRQISMQRIAEMEAVVGSNKASDHKKIKAVHFPTSQAAQGATQTLADASAQEDERYALPGNLANTLSDIRHNKNRPAGQGMASSQPQSAASSAGGKLFDNKRPRSSAADVIARPRQKE